MHHTVRNNYKYAKEYFTPFEKSNTDGLKQFYNKNIYRSKPLVTRDQVSYQQSNKNTFQQPNKNILNLNMKKYNNPYLHSPRVWGPSFWFTLHNGASHYPKNASRNHKDRMKGFILGIPMMLPCVNCKTHAIDFIEKNKNNLDKITSGRDTLFKFFVDFHNEVNKRYGRPEMSLKQAKKLFSPKDSIVLLKSYN